jgi:hypothetical protein
MSITVKDGNGAFVQIATLDQVIAALAPLATDADLLAVVNKTESVRALLAAALTINLPVGAATAALQSTGNSALANILTTLSTLATDADLQAVTTKMEAVRALLAAALTVQGTITANLGTLNGAALDATVSALGAKLDTLHGDVGGNHVDLGAILTQLKTTLAISAASLPLPAGAATDAKSEAIRALLASTLATAPAAGENHLGEVGGSSVVAIGSLTRQANTTAYGANTAVQASPAAPIALTVARKTAGTGRLSRLRLSKSGTSLTNAYFRVHLFKAAPSTLPSDAAAFVPSGALDYIGAFPVTMTRTFTDGAKGIGTPEVGGAITFDAAAGSTSLYALIEATAAYTPVSGEMFTIALEADRD